MIFKEAQGTYTTKDYTMKGWFWR